MSVLYSKEPQVYVFFSADLIGSTQKKQYAQKQDDEKALCISSWVSNVVEFYSSFEETFAKDGVELWKYNGDEILFYAKISSWDEALNHVKRFRDAIEKNNSPENKYPVKGAVWTAGFPIRNFILRKPAINNDCIDFIGPDIDLGFRIATLANRDRIAISPELALGLISVSKESREMKWHFYGRKNLKGIVEEGGIPVVFLSSTRDVISLQDKEEELLGDRLTPSSLGDFLELYFKQSQKWRKREFFSNSDEMKKNSYYADAYEEACSIIDKICQDDAIEELATADTSNVPALLNEIEIKKTRKTKKVSRKSIPSPQKTIKKHAKPAKRIQSKSRRVSK
jgi:hypothetical protein